MLPTKAQGSQDQVKGNLSKPTDNSCSCSLVLVARVVLDSPKGI